MMLGSGELGKEVVIALKRLGCTVVACDSYERAPAMQVADSYEVFSMLDGEALQEAVGKPTTRPYRRMAVALAYDRTNTESLEELRDRAAKIASEIKVH